MVCLNSSIYTSGNVSLTLGIFVARFVHNPHIVQASKHDYSLEPPSTRSTFPVPLPPYLPRGVAVPSTRLPVPDAASANSGRFSLGLKGMRRDLRRNGARAERLVKEIETELVEWLVGGTILLPDKENGVEVSFPGRAIGSYASEEIDKEDAEHGGIWEVSRTPLQLVWAIENDAFTRYVAHCCARYHSVVSFSACSWSVSYAYLTTRARRQRRLKSSPHLLFAPQRNSTGSLCSRGSRYTPGHGL